MALLKKAAVTIIELFVELVLLGALFSLIAIGQVKWAERPAMLLLGGPLIVFIVLFANFYYFIRPAVGLLWTGKAPWHYGVIAGLIFAAVASIAYVRDWRTFSPTAQISAAWFLPLGTAIVVMCAELGRRFLLMKLFGNE